MSDFQKGGAEGALEDSNNSLPDGKYLLQDGAKFFIREGLVEDYEENYSEVLLFVIPVIIVIILLLFLLL